LEHVLDDPKAFAFFDLEHFELVAVTDVDERQVIGAEVDRAGELLSEGYGSSLPDVGGGRPARRTD
jgi:hypothetical protein